MRFLALDLETTSYVKDHPEYALQPWRAKKREADITSMVCGNDDTALFVCDPPRSHNILYIWLWNGIFDIAWLIACGHYVEDIKWLDAMSAAKWVMRSQHTDHPTGKRTSWSLAAIAKQCLKDWEYYEEYIGIKETLNKIRELKNLEATLSKLENMACSAVKKLKIVDEIAEVKTHLRILENDEQVKLYLNNNKDYWHRRNILDVKATYLLGMGFWEAMTDKQRRGFLIEQEALYPAAQAWVDGYLYDFNAAEALALKIEERKNEISDMLRVGQKVLDSSKQLANLIYNEWGKTYDASVNSKNKTDHQSVSGPVLTLMMEKDPDNRLRLIKEYRDLKSRFDKFIKSPRQTREYLGSDHLHHQLRLNSTYTGRCTVSSKN